METSVIKQTITLNNGIPMPLLGLGVYQLRGVEAERAVATALEAGYRHIDTAALYGNERKVGRAVRESGIPRQDIFVTTKLFPTSFLWSEAAFRSSLEKLGFDYVDLYLIHWPAPGKSTAWKNLERLYDKKLMRSIGVSNYSIADLEAMSNYSAVTPAINQVEFHPFEYRKQLLEYCQSAGIAFEAYSPLNKGRELDHPVLQAIAKAEHKTPAQVMLRWSVQKGAIVIPKSSRKERIVENSKIFDWELSKDEMQRLDNLTSA